MQIQLETYVSGVPVLGGAYWLNLELTATAEAFENSDGAGEFMRDFTDYEVIGFSVDEAELIKADDIAADCDITWNDGEVFFNGQNILDDASINEIYSQLEQKDWVEACDA